MVSNVLSQNKLLDVVLLTRIFFVILWCDTEGILHGGTKILILCLSVKTIFFERAQGVSKMF